MTIPSSLKLSPATATLEPSSFPPAHLSRFNLGGSQLAGPLNHQGSFMKMPVSRPIKSGAHALTVFKYPKNSQKKKSSQEDSNKQLGWEVLPTLIPPVFFHSLPSPILLMWLSLPSEPWLRWKENGHLKIGKESDRKHKSFAGRSLQWKKLTKTNRWKKTFAYSTYIIKGGRNWAWVCEKAKNFSVNHHIVGFCIYTYISYEFTSASILLTELSLEKPLRPQSHATSTILPFVCLLLP